MYYNNTILSDNTYLFLCSLIKQYIENVLYDIEKCKQVYKNNYQYTICYRDLLLKYKYLLSLKIEFDNYKYCKDTITCVVDLSQNFSASVNSYLDNIRKVSDK